MYILIPMFFFKLKYSMAFTMCSQMAWLFGWIKHQQIASLSKLGTASTGGQVPNSNHHSLLDGTAGLTRLQCSTENSLEYPGINMNFLAFQLSNSFETNLIKIIIYHYLSNLKFIYTHPHLRFHAAGAGASTPTASFTRLRWQFGRRQLTQNKPLSDWNTELKQHYVRKNGSCPQLNYI